MKKIMSAALALAMTLTLAPTAFAAGGTAYASTQAVEVDGKKIEFQMYALKDASGNGTNYVKLRDVAHVLNGTGAQFSVGYDNVSKSIAVTTGAAYADTGTEMTTPYSGDRAYQTGSGAVLVDGAPASLDAIVLTDDAGGGYTYFKLRDLGSALGFQVDWTADRGVIIETGGSTQPTAPEQPEVVEKVVVLTKTNIEEYLDISATASDVEIEVQRSSIVGLSDSSKGTGKLTLTTESKVDGTFSDVTLKGYMMDRRFRWVGADKFTVYIDSDGAVSGASSNTFDINAYNPLSAILSQPDFEVELSEVTGTVTVRERVEPERPKEPLPEVDPESYALLALQYVYNRLKFPSTMQDVSIRTGYYDRSGKSGAIYSTTDAYYVVNISCKAANSFGALTSGTYVFLFNLTTGKSDYDWESRIESAIEDAWGERKLEWMKLRSEAILLRAGGQFTPLSRETVDLLVNEVRNMG